MWKYEKENVNISFKTFSRLYNIFVDKGWSFEEVSKNIFDNFCDMLGRLNEEQQELILELTENFLWLGVQKYTSELKNIFTKIASDNNRKIMDADTFHLVPLLKPEDIGKSKSSTFLAYFIKGNVRYFESLLNNKKIMVHDNYDDFFRRKDKFQNSIIFLIDDFIGTGDTAEKALSYLVNNSIPKEKVVVLAIVAQNEGIEKIRQMDIKIYVSQNRCKGISDIYSSAEAGMKLKIMDSIEDIINVKPIFRHGYNGSEALVSMNRTPNNTFPIYWLESKKIPKVPFPRTG